MNETIIGFDTSGASGGYLSCGRKKDTKEPAKGVESRAHAIPLWNPPGPSVVTFAVRYRSVTDFTKNSYFAGAISLAPPLCRILWVLSWPAKKVPPPAGDNYSFLRMILPLVVLGSSSRNSTILGYL